MTGRPGLRIRRGGHLAGLALLAAVLASAPAVAQAQPPPLQAVLRFAGGDGTEPPGGFATTGEIRLILTLTNTSGGVVNTTEGFSATEYWRRLYFTDPLGRSVINVAEAPIHATGRLYQCLSRGGVLLDVAIPVVPVEVLATDFVREYELDARQFFALSLPGRYTVQARIPLLTIAGGDLIVDCDQFPGQVVLDVGQGSTAQGFLVESNALQFSVVNTPAGADVVVTPTDTTSGQPSPDVTLTFDNVTGGGGTTVTPSSSGAPSPTNFSLGNPPVFYDIMTSATFTGNVEICITYTEAAFADETQVKLLHFEGGAWLDVTEAGYPDTVDNRVCGLVTSLSPFSAFQSVPPPNQPPVANAGSDQSVLTGNLVTLNGAGSQDPDDAPGPLGYTWVKTAGPAVSLSGGTTATPTFTPSLAGTYTFDLTVSDGAATANDSVTVVARTFSGFQKPLCTAVATGTPPVCGTFKGGGSIAVKFQLLGANGGAVNGGNVGFEATQEGGGGHVTGTFTFDSRKGTYTFNLNLKGLATGTWRIDAVFDPSIRRSVRFERR